MRGWLGLAAGLAGAALLTVVVTGGPPAPSGGPTPPDPPLSPTVSVPPQIATEPGRQLAVHPPADLDAARRVAGDFTAALFADRLDQLRTLVTDRYARKLLDRPVTDTVPRPGPAPTIDAVLIVDAHPETVAARVMVARPGRPLAAVMTRVVRTTDGWRIDNAAF